MLHLQTVQKSLGNYIDAGFPILYIHTFEDTVAEKYIASAAGDRDIVEWNETDGYVDFRTKIPFTENQTLEATLSLLKRGKELDRKLLVIKDADEYLKKDSPLKSDKAVAFLKEIAKKIRSESDGIDATIIIISPALHIPSELEKFITVLELDFPDEKEIRDIVDKFLEDNEIPAVFPGLIDKISTALKGITEFEIKDLLRLAVSQDGELTQKALDLILYQKQQIILKAGMLELIRPEESISDIGGLENLKDWLQSVSKVFKDIKTAMEFGVAMPKGILTVGFPGCGKGLSARAAGKLLDVPLLRLGMGRMIGKYADESEENLRRAIRLAEVMSPCVLWVNGLENAFEGVTVEGAAARLLCAFLTWMQEKTSPVFVIATANDITKLPSEIMRKGYFDKIFYVSRPAVAARKEIFEIHLRKRRMQDIPSIDIWKLAAKTKGYTGADIEGFIVESIEAAFAKGNSALTTEEILNCIENTASRSEVLKGAIGKVSTMHDDRNFKKASR